MSRLVFLLFGLGFWLSAVPAARADGLRRLEDDPSVAASAKLAELYSRTRDSDQRFWIVHALGVRLNEHDDGAALDALIAVAQEEENGGVRAPAMRALADYFSWGQRDVPDQLLARLDALAARGILAPSPAVKEGAETLKRSLQRQHNPASRPPSPPSGVKMARTKLFGRLARTARWLWLLILPAVVTAWAVLGLPVFDLQGGAGARARAAWEVLLRHKLFFSVTVFVWLCCAAVIAGYGFDILALTLGRPLYDVSGGWVKAYFVVGICSFLPGALLAAALARRPEANAAAACLPFVPGVIALWFVVFAALLPLGLVYRLILRRGRAGRAGGLFQRIFESGVFRSGYLAASVMACEDMGVVPALRRSVDLLGTAQAERTHLGLGVFDLRFALLCAAPVLAFFCSLIARGQPVQWTAPLAVVLFGCGLWSWAVLTGVLFAVVQGLKGICTARFYRDAENADVDEWGEL
ncbi:MAG: hypothetical protein ABIJ96_10845 [Elusimicrobiota bacterium]